MGTVAASQDEADGVTAARTITLSTADVQPARR